MQEDTPAYPHVAPKALAETYNPPSTAEPWDLVQQYHRVTDYAAAHPQRGSSAIASRLDVPRSRIRPWVDDDPPAKPDCVRAIEVAEANGWLTATYDDPQFAALNELVAWIFSGGSITANHVPMFAVADDVDRERVRAHLAALGLSARVTREDDASRATEVVPTEHASVFGRVLSLVGAPRGEKNSTTALSLPAYLDGAPDCVRRAFGRRYVKNRVGSRYAPGEPLHFRETRSHTYLAALAEFLTDAFDGPVSVSEKNVIVTSVASENLARFERVDDATGSGLES